jgi:hypothetical protein
MAYRKEFLACIVRGLKASHLLGKIGGVEVRHGAETNHAYHVGVNCIEVGVGARRGSKQFSLGA